MWGGALTTGSPRNSNADCSTLSLQKLNSHSSGFPTRSLVRTVAYTSLLWEASCSSRSLACLFLQSWWGRGMAPGSIRVSSPLLWIQKIQDQLIFPVCSAFYLLLGRSGDLKVLTCGTGNQSLPSLLYIIARHAST